MTKLDRDPASGTALQEISFWLNLERALNRIQEKRESPEVLLTLDILKHGKRFHATVSFDTDTGATTSIIYPFDLIHFKIILLFFLIIFSVSPPIFICCLKKKKVITKSNS